MYIRQGWMGCQHCISRWLHPYSATNWPYLFNLSLATASVPHQCKEACITPAPKVSAPQQPADYRPISITPILTRIMERAHSYQMVPTARSKRPETDEKGDRCEPGSMGANEKDRQSDKQRSSRSRRSHPMLPARRSPEPDWRVRVSRMPPIPESAVYVKRRELHSYIDVTGHLHLCWRIVELIEQ